MFRSLRKKIGYIFSRVLGKFCYETANIVLRK